MTEEWQTTSQLEDMVAPGLEGEVADETQVSVSEPPALDEAALALLDQPLQTRRKTSSVQRLVVAFSSLQRNMRLLAYGESVDPALFCVHVELLDQDRQLIEAALSEKRDAEAWGLFNDAWLRFVQVVPEDRFALLLSQRIHNKHSGTGTQTLVGYFDALREEAALLAHYPEIGPDQLRSYVLILEEMRPKIEQSLAEDQFDHAWFLVRGLWELRLGILPAKRLEAERKALELLLPSAGGKQRRNRLAKALEDAQREADVARQRSLLTWVKREINESAQARYWRFNIYQRRVEATAILLVIFLAVLSFATAVVLGLGEGDWLGWIHQVALIVAVLMAGSLGGAVSGLRTSEEISQQRISASYFKQAVTTLRMLVGAAAALTVYFLLASGLLAVTFGTGSQDLVYVALGFLTGFSERFFLQALDKAGGGSGIAEKEQAPVTPAVPTEPASAKKVDEKEKS